ncbi:concanavalin A-like lectin/glucanase domain-containing protein [Lasiosphaeris hirsuta]|uniref:Concanavalin A-like lectin/glucanase domain-containing protein n=1 Tax=Lasiosphaeris hirsuta TaxID=260670 RepID=A0AA40A859_9PEZI|nr:concanavalin A-like lectin/glucanase domain-containing protein [Lasiosphaeris hirsuta]
MRLPASLSSLLALISATIPLVIAAPSLTDHSSCGCFLTNGTEARFFSNHKFFDFRSQSQYAGVPQVITSADDSAEADKTSKFFDTTQWTDMWMVGSWNNSKSVRSDASVLMINSPNNVYIEANGDRTSNPQTWLTLRTQRLATFQTAAEIESTEKIGFQFLSMRMLARTIGAKGAITALFTYLHSDNVALVQEADLEVRTSDPPELVHYTNQPSYTAKGDTVEEATRNVTLPDGLLRSDWAVHRLDWTPTSNTWYVNGKQVAQISFQTPRDPSKIILNAWSDGGQWAGNMSVNDAAYLQIQWFEVVYNGTAGVHTHKAKRDDQAGREHELVGRADEGCKAVCSIDETPSLGQPVMLWNNEAGRIRGQPGGGGLVGWIPSASVAAMFVVSAGLWR